MGTHPRFISLALSSGSLTGVLGQIAKVDRRNTCVAQLGNGVDEGRKKLSPNLTAYAKRSFKILTAMATASTCNSHLSLQKPSSSTSSSNLFFANTSINLPSRAISSPLSLSIQPPKTPLNPKSKSSQISDLSPPNTLIAPPTLKTRLANGETLYGIFLLSFSPTLAEISGLAGYDFVVIDMEHGPGGIPEALQCLRALGGTGTPAILRLPESSEAWAKKALDLGPHGIMFPMIETAKSAKKAVSYCRFPPSGVRGSAHTVVRASNYGINDGYLANYEEELLIMCQVESAEGVKKIEEIAAVDGVDCIQMGPLDLSASLGYLWDPGNKKVREVLREAEKGVLKSKGTEEKGKKSGDGGAYLAGFAMPHDKPEQLKMRGYHMVSGAVDVGLFRSAALEDVKRFKMDLIKDSDNEEDEKYFSE